MWELEHKENWALKNWCFWTVVLEMTPGLPLDCKETEPVQTKGNQSWIFIGKTDAEVEVPILGPPNSKNWLIWKDPDAGKDWRQGKKGMTEDEMVGWHHWLDGHEFEQAPGVGDRQGGLVFCSQFEDYVVHNSVNLKENCMEMEQEMYANKSEATVIHLLLLETTRNLKNLKPIIWGHQRI